MALTKEQFMELRKQRLSVDQIVRFERGEKPKHRPVFTGQDTSDIQSSFLKDVGGVLQATGKVLSVPRSMLTTQAQVLGTTLGGLTAGIGTKRFADVTKAGIGIASEESQQIGKKMFSNEPSKALGLEGGAGLAVDILGDPLNLLYIKPVEKVASAVSEPVKVATQKVATGTKKVLTAGKELKTVRAEQATEPLKRLEINQVINETRAASKAKLAEMTDTFRNAASELGRGLSTEAQSQSVANKGKLKELFKAVTETYGKGLSDAESALIESGEQLSTKKYVVDVVDKTINEAVARGVSEGESVMKNLFKIKKTLGKATELKVESLRPIRDSVGKISSAVESAKYSDAGDQVIMLFTKNHGQFIGEHIPDLAELNKYFAPMANARSWATKVFKPFNIAEVQRGANVLERYAKGEIPDATIMNYLKTLEEGSGPFAGAGKLTGRTITIGEKIRDTKEAFNVAKATLIAKTDSRIFSLKKELADLAVRGIMNAQKEKELESMVKIKRALVAIALGSTFLPPAVKRFLGLGTQ